MIVITNTGKPINLESIMDAQTPTAAYIIVDADVAKAMQDRNIEPQKGLKGANRKSSPMIYGAYAADMLSGRWEPTNQGIGFNVQGKVVDGAHRIKGVLQAAQFNPNYNTVMLVCGGLSMTAKRRVDIGRKRYAAQFLQMEGEVSPSYLASALKIVYCYDHVPYTDLTSWQQRIRFTDDEMFDMLDNCPTIRTNIVEANRFKGIVHISTAAAFIFLALRDCPEGNPRGFMEKLHSGAGINATDAVYRLREFLRRKTAQGEHLNRFQHLAHLIKAFNQHLVDETYFPSFKKTDREFPRIDKAPVQVADPDDV